MSTEKQTQDPDHENATAKKLISPKSNNFFIYTNVPKVENNSICPICGEEAPKGEIHHPHYGGICCYSCRAFFRRAHQRSKNPKFICKKDGKCPIVAKEKCICKKCRYLKCLSIGMNAKWVLSNDEKRVRFEKFFKRKDEKVFYGPGEEKLRISKQPKNLAKEKIPRKRGRKRKVDVAENLDRDERERMMDSVQTFSSTTSILESYSQPVALSTSANLLKPDEQHQITAPFVDNSCSSQLLDPNHKFPSDTPTSFHHLAKKSFLDNPCYESPPSNSKNSLLNGVKTRKRNNHSTQSDRQYKDFQPYIGRDSEDFSYLPSTAKNSSDERMRCSGIEEQPLSQNQMWQRGHQIVPFVLNVSGANYLIQRLPDDDQCSEKSDCHDQIPTSDCLKTSKSETDMWRRNNYHTTSTRNFDWNQTTLGRLSCTLDSFSIISSRSMCDAFRAYDFVSNHLRQSPLQKSTLISHSTLIAKMITEFAMSQALFMSLDPSDKLTLLNYNAPLYVQYILARYFFSETGMEQLTWILEGQVPISSLDEVTNLRRISFNEYNSTVNFIQSTEKAMMYSHHIENIGLFYPFPENCNGLVANLFLYHIDETIAQRLVEPKRISCIFEDSRELINEGHTFLDQRLSVEVSSNIRPLINALKKMKSIFEDCYIPSATLELLPNLTKPFMVSYTNTEESWLKHQFQLFREEFYSVAPPKRYLEELIALLLFNDQVSNDHISLYVRMTTERMRRVIKIHHEFNCLKDTDQEIVLQRNTKVGLALTIARLNLYQTGKDQLRSALGHLGDNNTDWETQYQWPFRLEQLKRAARLEENEIHLGRLSQELISLFTSLFREVSELVPSDELYQIFTLISMLDTTGMPENEGISGMFKMRQIYLKLFQRRLSANGFPQLTYDRFKQILGKLLQFADIMTSMFSL